MHILKDGICGFDTHAYCLCLNLVDHVLIKFITSLWQSYSKSFLHFLKTYYFKLEIKLSKYFLVVLFPH